MKKIKWISAIGTILLLTACSFQKHSSVEEKAESSKTAPTSASTKEAKKQTGDFSTEAADARSTSPTMDKTVSYNGSYYSVQGKYGEVLVVNKHYPLSPDYNPGEDPEAQASLLELIAAMQEQGYAISDQYSGFRSYDTQSSLYQNYVARDGQAAADRYSARPGYSEHQTGLAYDLIDTSGNLVQEKKASKWLLKHAAEYGFVVRYLYGKEKETGYMPEEWHLRYVGKEAKDIAKSGLTLEEYYGFTGGDYED
ncbi:LD-carboxypeptidase LdcB/DacB [Streptococcus himalayensis]|uniref:D-alanyl-D-alanine carboxypeptidase n=1 Tax=Streptococcus himalayensis TaxID=1888195 RepID=A0A917A746_9STRE|nr:LD-carboxypeptidase LdcB/DacB [Streptococcus himalayensis]GGE32527.1 D-alanyl-D-alanine carboxypeptidase [Streptococcus himalayensis]